MQCFLFAFLLAANQQIVAPNYGVDWERLSGESSYFLNGREISRAEAVQALRAGSLVDDSQLLRLTLIGSESDCAAVLKDLASYPALAAWKAKVLIQSYRPDDRMLSVGFVRAGSPMIYLQLPDGKVLLRLNQYPGPEKLTAAIRKSDPFYDPQKDPNGDGGGLAPFGLLPVAGCCLAAILVIAGWLWWKDRRGSGDPILAAVRELKANQNRSVARAAALIELTDLLKGNQK